MDNTELKPCPFCGKSNPNLTLQGFTSSAFCFITCLQCSASISEWSYFLNDAETKARDAWNRRVK